MIIAQPYSLYAGIYSGPQANVTGRSAKTVREYLEKHYSPEAVKTRDDTIILAIKALLEVVQSGSKSMELALMEKGKPLEVCRRRGRWVGRREDVCWREGRRWV